jgi:DNA phosphorothioation-associated DGQHR protein 1
MAHIFRGPALRVRQPLGDFWVAAIPARILLQSTSPDPLRLAVDPASRRNPRDWELAGDLVGNQRPLEEVRLKDIGRYIETVESTFPNSIILAAPSLESEAVDVASGNGKGSRPWRIVEAKNSPNSWTLTIPEQALKASVVDGQHRLYAFTRTKESSQDFELLCSIFFDLPYQMQALIFATINTNQKAVRRGLAMNLYGYNVEDEDRNEWSPEKFSVFMARRLNFDPDSPLHHRIRVEAENAPPAVPLVGAKRPMAMAAVVDGICGLISRNPKADRTTLRTKTIFSRPKRKDLGDDGAVLRDWYVEGRDAELYDLLRTSFSTVFKFLWTEEAPMLFRAVDVRGLLDFLADVVRKAREDGRGNARKVVESVGERWTAALRGARRVDFSDPFFEATYRGRRRVQNALRLVNKMTTIGEMPDADRDSYRELLRP